MVIIHILSAGSIGDVGRTHEMPPTSSKGMMFELRLSCLDMSIMGLSPTLRAQRIVIDFSSLRGIS